MRTIDVEHIIFESSEIFGKAVQRVAVALVTDAYNAACGRNN